MSHAGGPSYANIAYFEIHPVNRLRELFVGSLAVAPMRGFHIA
jgi:hypothetical protein